jgi:biotin carboxyl carrier protein
MVHYSKYIWAGLVFITVFWACHNKQSDNSNPPKENTSRTIDTVHIVHATLPVTVPITGYLEYWKKETLFSSDSSQIISVLVENGQPVLRNEYLLSLWQLDNSKEFTPFDIYSPFEGIIEKVFVKIGSRVGPGNPLLHIYNNDFFITRRQVSEGQLKFIKKNQKVIQKNTSQAMEGYVEEVNNQSNIIEILLKNRDHRKPPLNKVNLEIICGNVSGDFIPSVHFKNSRITAYIDDESSFELRQIGISDSLSLVSPALPQLTQLSVISHK